MSSATFTVKPTAVKVSFNTATKTTTTARPLSPERLTTRVLRFPGFATLIIFGKNEARTPRNYRKKYSSLRASLFPFIFLLQVTKQFASKFQKMALTTATPTAKVSTTVQSECHAHSRRGPARTNVGFYKNIENALNPKNL